MQSDIDRGWLIHTHVVLEKLGETLSDLLHAEVSLRNYILTGEDSYMKPYQDAAEHLVGHLNEVRKLTADNPVQQVSLGRMEPLLKARLGAWQEWVELRQREESTSGFAGARISTAKQSMDRIGAGILELTGEEQRLLVLRSAAADASSQESKLVIIIVDFLAIFASAAAGLVVRRDIEQRVRTAGEIRSLNEKLERRVIERTEQFLTANTALSSEIGERKKIERILHEKNSDLQNAGEAKDRFLANMSHELRTPLNGIIGFAELLADGKPGSVNAKQSEYVKDILNSGRHLLQVVGDVLDLAKVGAGTLELNLEQFSLREAIQESCAVARPLAEKRKIRIKLDVAPEIGEVTLDRKKFQQVLYNLLSNAIKFNHDGGLVELRAAQSELGFVKLVVSDAGIGIKAENVGRLFQEFVQIESGASRKYEGTGLGLALTRKIVELQGGTIGVASAIGKGSHFTVILPLVLKSNDAVMSEANDPL